MQVTLPLTSSLAVLLLHSLFFFHPRLLFCSILLGNSHTCDFGEGSPIAITISFDVVDEALVFLFGPCTYVGVGHLTKGGRMYVFCVLKLKEQRLEVRENGDDFPRRDEGARKSSCNLKGYEIMLNDQLFLDVFFFSSFLFFFP